MRGHGFLSKSANITLSKCVHVFEVALQLTDSRFKYLENAKDVRNSDTAIGQPYSYRISFSDGKNYIHLQ